jgi:flagellin
MLSVNTNMNSLVAQNNLMSSQTRLNSSLQKLSTGLQINSAADNPAGLVTSSLENAQISGLQQSIQNIQTGSALVQTADSSLANINDLLVQVRSLAANSANSATQSTASLAANQANATALLSSIDNIATTTKFGTVALLDGSFTAAKFQTGAFSGQQASLTIAKSDSTTLSVNSVDLTTAAGATAALTAIDAAISTVASARGNLIDRDSEQQSGSADKPATGQVDSDRYQLPDGNRELHQRKHPSAGRFDGPWNGEPEQPVDHEPVAWSVIILSEPNGLMRFKGSLRLQRSLCVFDRRGQFPFKSESAPCHPTSLSAACLPA